MRVLLVQRTLDPPGGGNAVAAWMLQALAHHDLTTLTERPWSTAAVDQFYGTTLSASRITQRTLHGLGARLRVLPGRLDRLHMALLFRAATKIADDMDVLMTADNYGAFKRPGIQYLHYPADLRPTPDRFGRLVRAYYIACDAISGLSWDAARQNHTLANSNWTARHLAHFFGIDAEVLYPPVANPGESVPWRDRENTFLCIGRFHGSKRIETVVDILDRVRAEQRDIRLAIIGSNVDREYTQRLERVTQSRPWIAIHQDLPQSELFAVMRRSRYGIHAMDREHFGMAPAEMARAGCIVFGHNSGGIIEVLDGRRELLWDTPELAVRQIITVLRSPELQRSLSASLVAHAQRFAVEVFVREFRRIVDSRLCNDGSV